ncbi:MAG TPA: copper-binding protein [Candidatus Binatia bacterium]|nr:copper-binding protein [Candidatus Binatia bacterium]
MINRLAAVSFGILIAVGTSAAGEAATSQIHGTIVSVDSAHRTVEIHHDPFAAMPMSMTMVVKVPNAADLAKLHKGTIVNADIDTSKDPWILSHVKVVEPKH